MSIPMDAEPEGSNINNWFDLNQAYIAAADGVHGQQVVPVAQLELDHVLRWSEVSELLLLRLTALLDQILQEESVFTHPLDGLQQVRSQVHLIAQLQLLVLQSTGTAQKRASARVKIVTEEKHQRLPWKNCFRGSWAERLSEACFCCTGRTSRTAPPIRGKHTFISYTNYLVRFYQHLSRATMTTSAIAHWTHYHLKVWAFIQINT